MSRFGKIKRLNLTHEEIAKRFPDALEFADWQLDDLHARGEVSYLVTRKNKLQCHVMITESPMVKLSVRAMWHADASTWVRYSCGFRWRDNYPEPRKIRAGDLLYLAEDGSVTPIAPTRPGSFVMVAGIALSDASDDTVAMVPMGHTPIPNSEGRPPGYVDGGPLGYVNGGRMVMRVHRGH